ncbi:MAG: hypothetical protein F9B45_16930 [Phycisphaera sp. RhM]|nr:hypothetical protein [Phycisphaera sp. RhM]
MRIAEVLPALLVLCASFTAPCFGGIIISGDVNAGTGVLTISDDITFDITSDGIAQILNFDEWGDPQDGTQDFLGSFAGTISFQVNGSDVDRPLDFILDNLTSTLNQLTPNDAYIGWFPSLAVSTGDVVTIESGSWAIPTATDWNPATTGSFNGNVFLTDNNGNQVSSAVSISAVPEPNSAMFFGCVALGISLGRHRKRRRITTP